MDYLNVRIPLRVDQATLELYERVAASVPLNKAQVARLLFAAGLRHVAEQGVTTLLEGFSLTPESA